MDNTKRSYDDYKKDVLRHLQEYGNFKSPDDEAKAYMASDEVDKRIRDDYEHGQPPESCAWGLDMLY